MSIACFDNMFVLVKKPFFSFILNVPKLVLLHQ